MLSMIELIIIGLPSATISYNLIDLIIGESETSVNFKDIEPFERTFQSTENEFCNLESI